MAHILSYATHLRATCEFEKGSLSNADYLRGKVADLDLMVQLYGPCITFEQISIRSVGCSDCQAKYWAGSGMHAHITSTEGESCSCPNCVAWLGTNSEDSFGLYGTRSTDHQCARDNQATTQWWLGVNTISPQWKEKKEQTDERRKNKTRNLKKYGITNFSENLINNFLLWCCLTTPYI